MGSNDDDVNMDDSSPASEFSDAVEENVDAAESSTKNDVPSKATAMDTSKEAIESAESSGPTTKPIHSTTGSIVATLKAAFEPASPASENGKPHFPNDKTSDQASEIARLEDALTKEKDIRVAYEEKVTTLEDEIEELNAQLEEQEEEWRAESEQRRERERAEMQERLLATTEEARNQRHEIVNLQKQLSDLKKSVSASTRPSTHVTDATFRDEAGVLQHEVQNWIVQNFRRVKIEVGVDELCKKLEAVTDPGQFARLQPLYQKFDLSVKLPMLQATVSCFLMDIFDEPYLYGLHGQVQWADRSRQAAEALLSVLQPAAYNRCRAVTLDALRQSGSVKEVVESSAQGLSQTIIKALTAVTAIEESEARLTSLISILKRAIDLAHLLRVQQAKYDVVLPPPDDIYDAAYMDDILEEGDDDSENPIKFSTFPAIFKTTDEEGNELDSRNIIAKAKVLCTDAET